MSSDASSTTPSSTTSSTNPPDGTTTTTVSGGQLSAKLPNGHRLVERTMKDAAWPSDLILDLAKSNWTEWNHMLKLAVRQCGIRPWLEGSIPCPDLAASPDAYHIWTHNDDSLSAFITRYISKSDVPQTESCNTASEIYTRLRSLHEQQGAYAQLSLFTKVLQIRLTYDTPLDDTVAEIATFHKSRAQYQPLPSVLFNCSIQLRAARLPVSLFLSRADRPSPRVPRFGCAERGSCSSCYTVWHFDGPFFIDHFYQPCPIPDYHSAMLRESRVPCKSL